MQLKRRVWIPLFLSLAIAVGLTVWNLSDVDWLGLVKSPDRAMQVGFEAGAIVSSRITSPLTSVNPSNHLALEKLEPRLNSFRESEYSKNKPISVYGRVVDQHDQPVPGVKMMVDLGYVPYLVVPGMGWSTKAAMVTSDENGEFSVENQTGTYLSLIKAEKSGYQFGNSFRYNVSSGTGNTFGSPASRLIIHAWKIEATKTRAREGSLSVMFKSNGQFVSIDFDQTLHGAEITAGPPIGDLYVAVNTTAPDASGYFDLTMTLRAVSGGIQEHKMDERFPYLAPESGYVPEWSKTVPHVRAGDYEHRFYLKSRGGSRYSEIFLSASPSWRGEIGKAMMAVRFTSNLDGARELPRN